MKKILILLLLALWALTACSPSSSSDPATPTGVSSDEIGQPQIMYGDEVYYYFATGFDEALPEHYAYAGTVKDVDNKNPPSGNFSASRLEEGQKVYADGDNSDVIYIEYENGYARFSKRETEQASSISASEQEETVSAEIKAAIEKKMETFEEDCLLTDLWYDEEKCESILDSYMKYGKGSASGVARENVAVVLSDLKTGDNTWSLEPNTVYTDWNWILIRENETSDWIVDDYGNP